jgi:hypothetical protein
LLNIFGSRFSWALVQAKCLLVYNSRNFRNFSSINKKIIWSLLIIQIFFFNFFHSYLPQRFRFHLSLKYLPPRQRKKITIFSIERWKTLNTWWILQLSLNHLKSWNQIKYSYTNKADSIRYFFRRRADVAPKNINICSSNSHQKSK